MNFDYSKLSDIKNISNCIYKVTNIVNGKVYIGKTEATLILRIRRHCCEARKGTNRYFYDAIRCYGWDSFSVEVIETCHNLEELNEREIYWISILKSNNKEFGYNLTEGGDGCGFSVESLKKSADKRRGKPVSDEVKKKISEGNKGKKVTISDETKKKISAALTGKHHDPSRYNPRRGKPGAMLGKKHTEESKKLMSLHQTGLPRWTEDQKKQMSIYRVQNGNPFWIDINKDLLESLLRGGLSLEEIALKFNVSEPTILARIKLYFGFNGINEIHFEWIQKPILISSISEGLLSGQIAEKLGCHKSGLLRKIRKLGFKSLKDARRSLIKDNHDDRLESTNS